MTKLNKIKSLEDFKDNTNYFKKNNKVGTITDFDIKILEHKGYDKHRHRVFLCQCHCGKTFLAISGDLKKLKSCGCSKKRLKNNIKHSLYKSKIYRCFLNLKDRCLNKNSYVYKNYGGRGIKVCDEWLDKENGFMNFYNWAMANGYKEGLSIDRIDNNGNYEPSNCRWVDTKIQDRNRRTNKYITYNGITYCLTELAEKYGVNYQTFYSRLFRSKWSLEKSLNINNN